MKSNRFYSVFFVVLFGIDAFFFGLTSADLAFAQAQEGTLPIVKSSQSNSTGLDPLQKEVSFDLSTTSELLGSIEELLDRGLGAFYRADWNEAEQLFSQASELAPHDPRAYFFTSMIPFWGYFFVSESSEAASKYFSKSAKALELSKKQLEMVPDDSTMILLLSGIYGYRSLMAAKESRYMQAMKNGIAGFGFTNQLLAYSNMRADVRIGRGLYYYMVGSIPSEVRWMFTLFREKGSIEKGFQELQLAAQDNSYIGDEAKMILAYLYEKEKKHQDAITYLDLLIQEYPQNPIFLFLKASNLRALGEQQAAFLLYRQLSEGENPSFSALHRKSKDLADLTSR